MGFLDLAIHGLNFVAPALFIGAVLLALPRRWMPWRLPMGQVLAIIFIANCVVLTTGLAYFGNDGKAWTYVGLCVVSAILALILSQSKRA